MSEAELSVPKREDDPTFRHMHLGMFENLIVVYREDCRQGREMEFHPWAAQFVEVAIVDWWLLTPQERDKIQALIASTTNERLAAKCRNSDASPAGNAVGRPKASNGTGVRKKNFCAKHSKGREKSKKIPRESPPSCGVSRESGVYSFVA